MPAGHSPGSPTTSCCHTLHRSRRPTPGSHRGSAASCSSGSSPPCPTPGWPAAPCRWRTPSATAGPTSTTCSPDSNPPVHSSRMPIVPAIRSPFEYAILRVVPREDRGEAFNAGIVLHSRARRYLGAKVELDADVLQVLAPGCDPAVVRAQLETIPRMCAGDPATGPIAALSRPERFHWLVSPSSTVVQA